MTPSKLAKLIGRHVSTISIHLAKLRSADVVRYDTSGKTVRYWLKHKGEIKGLIKDAGKGRGRIVEGGVMLILTF